MYLFFVFAREETSTRGVIAIKIIISSFFTCVWSRGIEQANTKANNVEIKTNGFSSLSFVFLATNSKSRLSPGFRTAARWHFIAVSGRF